MKIGVDARGLHWPGVGRYIRELIHGLAEVDNKNHYIIYFSSRDELESNPFTNQNFKSAVVPVPCMTMKEQLLLPLQLMKDKLDLFHATCFVAPIFHPCPFIVTIHDLQLKINRDWFPPLRGIRKYSARAYYDFMNWNAVSYSRKIITVSHHTRKEILRYFPRAEKKLAVIHHGINPNFHPVKSPETISRIKEKYNIHGKYILFVGTLNKRKNLSRLLSAFSELQGVLHEYKLVVAAKIDHRYPEPIKLTEQLGIVDKVLYIGYVPSGDLPPLYSGSSVCVIPTVHESFCFPVVEAMACGVPVITSNVTSLPEIAGDAAYLVNPYNTEDMKEAIQKVISDQSVRNILIEKGLSRVKQFSWRTAAEKVVAIYEEVSKGK